MPQILDMINMADDRHCVAAAAPRA